MPAERKCRECGDTKPLDSRHFYPKGTTTDGETRHDSTCIECRLEQRKKRKDNPDTKASYARALYRLRDRHPEEFKQLLDEERR